MISKTSLNFSTLPAQPERAKQSQHALKPTELNADKVSFSGNNGSADKLAIFCNEFIKRVKEESIIGSFYGIGFTHTKNDHLRPDAIDLESKISGTGSLFEALNSLQEQHIEANQVQLNPTDSSVEESLGLMRSFLIKDLEFTKEIFSPIGPKIHKTLIDHINSDEFAKAYSDMVKENEEKAAELRKPLNKVIENIVNKYKSDLIPCDYRDRPFALEIVTLQSMDATGKAKKITTAYANFAKNDDSSNPFKSDKTERLKVLEIIDGVLANPARD